MEPGFWEIFSPLTSSFRILQLLNRQKSNNSSTKMSCVQWSRIQVFDNETWCVVMLQIKTEFLCYISSRVRSLVSHAGDHVWSTWSCDILNGVVFRLRIDFWWQHTFERIVIIFSKVRIFGMCIGLEARYFCGTLMIVLASVSVSKPVTYCFETNLSQALQEVRLYKAPPYPLLCYHRQPKLTLRGKGVM